jgi:hypothetical protein
MSKFLSSIEPDPSTRPSFNDWAKEFNVSSSYVEPDLRNDNFKLTKPLRPKKEESFWSRLFRKLF